MSKTIIFLLIAMLLISGCQQIQKTDKITITTTIFPLAEFANAIGKDKIDVIQLLPSGASPHSWEPLPSDIAKIENSKIFIFIGPSLEPWAEKLIKANKNLIVINAENISSLIKKDKIDPHLWLDFENDKKILKAILSALTKIDPENKEEYVKNYKEYISRLNKLESEAYTLKKCKHNAFIVGGHSAFGYLAKSLNLTQITISGLSPDAEPNPKKIIEILNYINKTHIKKIVFEKMASPKIAEALSEEANVGIVTLNPAPTRTAEEINNNISFIDIMQQNIRILKDILECNQTK